MIDEKIKEKEKELDILQKRYEKRNKLKDIEKKIKVMKRKTSKLKGLYKIIGLLHEDDLE